MPEEPTKKEAPIGEKKRPDTQPNEVGQKGSEQPTKSHMSESAESDEGASGEP